MLLLIITSTKPGGSIRTKSQYTAKVMKMKLLRLTRLIMKFGSENGPWPPTLAPNGLVDLMTELFLTDNQFIMAITNANL